MMFKLALVIMNSWTGKTAEVSELLFSITGITQMEIADKLEIAQSTVNERIKRGAVHEIIELEQYYKNKFKEKQI
jgi:DNA-binding transcriptional regulator LsrR (DeoR family)